jgi:site-specific DNA-adenine methylase
MKMIVLVDKSFNKDVSKIIDKKLLNAIADCNEDVQKLTKFLKSIFFKYNQNTKAKKPPSTRGLLLSKN